MKQVKREYYKIKLLDNVGKYNEWREPIGKAKQVWTIDTTAEVE